MHLSFDPWSPVPIIQGREGAVVAVWTEFKAPLGHLQLPCGSAGKESACNAGDLDLIPGLGRSPGEGKGYPLQYPGQGNSVDCIVHGVTKSRTRLSNFHFCFINYAKAFDCVDHKKLWKTLKEMERPDHLYLSRWKAVCGSRSKFRTLYGTTDWFKIEKGV